MRADVLLKILAEYGIDFFAGLPDSQLKALCDELMRRYGIDEQHHLIAHNEGGCAALAAGYHLATGKVPCVYMQNSGIGNMLNPAASLLSPKVYGIPVLYIVGWRGRPGTKDEPQHVFQGEITLELLNNLEIATRIVTPDTPQQQIQAWMDEFGALFTEGKSAALVVEKNAVTQESGKEYPYHNKNTLVRERAIELIARQAGEGILVSSTGKISRELFEARERAGQGHEQDFLTVGSMGHASSIALGIALQKPALRVWCVDGDGALIMHMGALALVGACAPKNLVHICLNNGAHETVGGMPTPQETLDLPGIARAAGYAGACRAVDEAALLEAMAEATRGAGPAFIEVPVALGARKDLGRPTATPQQNKQALMEYIENF